MKLDLTRKILTAESTIGELLVNGKRFCVTLEDVVRDRKIDGETAIPAGSYAIEIKKSPKFGRLMPRLIDVPGYTGVLIHWGNTAKDTEGCILVGESSSKNFVGSSRVTFDALFDTLQQASKGGQAITITIR
ncbi:DUF5675 family protein [Falsiroseomonas sp. HW251]|uniref:DUF5675 family protein n=1 Tax=Falsiroseomonas sp. HW251 TaxID=3390998 RepID=UPI003D318036